LAITKARALHRDDIRCDQCGNVRTVDTRQARRWREGHIAGTCITCRGGSATRVCKDGHLAFWLTAYGVKVPRGKAREIITAGGTPPELVQLAKDVWGDD